MAERSTDDDVAHHGRADFDEPVTDAALLTDARLGLVTGAREESGEAGETAAERQRAEQAAIRTFLTTVRSVEDLHPHLRQITFAGGDLDTFSALGADTFLYLLLPPPGRDALTIDQSFAWQQRAAMPEEDRPVGAYYTLRRWRPETAELDIHVVLHDDAGPASAWAARARPGDPVALWGPRTAYHPPADTEHLLLVADETGLPAVAAILEQRPASVTATVLAEVPGPHERPELPGDPGVEIAWLHRDGAEPGTATVLADAARALPPQPERTYVWGGGESRAMTAVRKEVRHRRGFTRERVSLVAYWRHPSSPPEEG